MVLNILYNIVKGTRYWHAAVCFTDVVVVVVDVRGVHIVMIALWKHMKILLVET